MHHRDIQTQLVVVVSVPNFPGDFICDVIDPLPAPMARFKKALQDDGLFTFTRGNALSLPALHVSISLVFTSTAPVNYQVLDNINLLHALDIDADVQCSGPPFPPRAAEMLLLHDALLSSAFKGAPNRRGMF